MLFWSFISLLWKLMVHLLRLNRFHDWFTVFVSETTRGRSMIRSSSFWWLLSNSWSSRAVDLGVIAVPGFENIPIFIYCQNRGSLYPAKPSGFDLKPLCWDAWVWSSTAVFGIFTYAWSKWGQQIAWTCCFLLDQLCNASSFHHVDGFTIHLRTIKYHGIYSPLTIRFTCTIHLGLSEHMLSPFSSVVSNLIFLYFPY